MLSAHKMTRKNMNKPIITEKPSVGAAYAALLGAKKRMDGYWEGNG